MEDDVTHMYTVCVLEWSDITSKTRCFWLSIRPWTTTERLGSDCYTPHNDAPPPPSPYARTTNYVNLQVTVNVIAPDDMAVSPDKQSYMLPFLVRFTGRAKVLMTPDMVFGGIALPINSTSFSRSRIEAPGFVPSLQVMVRSFPSGTVTAPTGSIVTWATDTVQTPISIVKRTVEATQRQ